MHTIGASADEITSTHIACDRTMATDIPMSDSTSITIANVHNYDVDAIRRHLLKAVLDDRTRESRLNYGGISLTIVVGDHNVPSADTLTASADTRAPPTPDAG